MAFLFDLSNFVILLPFFFLQSVAQESTVCARNVSLPDIKTAFYSSGIVPGVIPMFNPSGVLDVVFTVPGPTAPQTVNATAATNLTVQQTTNEPQFYLTSDTTIGPDVEFVIALFDPDAPTPQNASLGQFRHLLGGGYRWTVSGANSGILTNSTPALTEFFSDPHRYIILLYVQPPDFEPKASLLVNGTTPRTNFNITTFGDAVGLGSPFAGTFFFEGPAGTASSSASGIAASPTHPASDASRSASLDVATVFAFIMAVYLSN